MTKCMCFAMNVHTRLMMSVQPAVISKLGLVVTIRLLHFNMWPIVLWPMVLWPIVQGPVVRKSFSRRHNFRVVLAYVFHRCRKRFLCFYYFYKNEFLTFFYFWKAFYTLVTNFFYPTKPSKILLNLLNSCIKRLVSDGFNILLS